MRFLAQLLAALCLCGIAARSQTLLVLDKEEAALAIVDLTSSKVLAKIPVGEQPHEIAVSGDGRMAFVTNYGTGPNPGKTISVIDVAARRELRRVDVSPLKRPHGIFWAAGKVYFTAEANKLIATYDPAADRVDWVLGTGQNTTHMVMLNRTGSQIYTANIGSNTITIIDVVKNFEETSVPVGKGPEGFDVSPDGRQIWAANSQDGSVSVIDIASKKVIGTIDLGTKRSNRLKFTPDGRMVLVSDLNAGEVLFVDAASHKILKRLPTGKTTEGILMMPDGLRALVAVAGEDAIAIIDLKSMQETGRFSPGKGPDGMVLIP